MKRLILSTVLIMGILLTNAIAKNYTDYSLKAGSQYVCIASHVINAGETKKTELSQKQRITYLIKMNNEMDIASINNKPYKYVGAYEGRDVYMWIIPDGEGKLKGSKAYFEIENGEQIENGNVFMGMYIKIIDNNDKLIFAYSGACSNYDIPEK